MNKERANEIMRELKENCKGRTCYNCVFGDNDGGCKLTNYDPEGYTLDILNEKEKEYLSNVVKPFRDKVKYIKKIYAKDEYIKIVLSDELINFPNFKRGTMYKGMEIDKEYTLEELGI